MNQPTVRTKLTHDPSSMEGQAYVPITIALEVSCTSGSGYADIYTVPQDVWLDEAVMIVTTAFDDGTVILGTDGDTDALIAAGQLTATTLGNVASSRQTTLPDGLVFTALDVIRISLGGACTEGTVLVLLKMWSLSGIESHGFHNSFEV